MRSSNSPVLQEWSTGEFDERETLLSGLLYVG
jgi:hypothetical protein